MVCRARLWPWWPFSAAPVRSRSFTPLAVPSEGVSFFPSGWGKYGRFGRLVLVCGTARVGRVWWKYVERRLLDGREAPPSVSPKGPCRAAQPTSTSVPEINPRQGEVMSNGRSSIGRAAVSKTAGGGSSPPAHASRWDHQLGMVPSGVLRLWCNRPTHLPPTQEIAGSSPAGHSPKFWGFMGEVPESG